MSFWCALFLDTALIGCYLLLKWNPNLWVEHLFLIPSWCYLSMLTLVGLNIALHFFWFFHLYCKTPNFQEQQQGGDAVTDEAEPFMGSGRFGNFLLLSRPIIVDSQIQFSESCEFGSTSLFIGIQLHGWKGARCSSEILLIHLCGEASLACYWSCKRK